MIRKNESDLVAKINDAGLAAMSTVIARARFYNSAIIGCRDGKVVELNPFELQMPPRTSDQSETTPDPSANQT